jgi:hypothetical protein
VRARRAEVAGLQREVRRSTCLQSTSGRRAPIANCYRIRP